ncbi:hypothetical protein AB0E01_18105 [Nocardia vinacea]|uniref:hypothetical protein n=1 Tax=Nocardia vinacea TaxID=96468 RepID=UPI0033DEA11E
MKEVYASNLRIFDVDRAIVEIQKEVNVPADRGSVAYRRALRGLGSSRFFTA